MSVVTHDLTFVFDIISFLKSFYLSVLNLSLIDTLCDTTRLHFMCQLHVFKKWLNIAFVKIGHDKREMAYVLVDLTLKLVQA